MCKKFTFSAIFLLTTTVLMAAEPTVATTMVKTEKTIFHDDLNGPFKPEWKTAKGKWTAQDGGIRGVELKEDMHGAVSRRDAKFTDGAIQLSIKLDGAKQASLSMNGSKGHICRVLIRPSSFSVNKDDQDGKNGPDKGEVLSTCTTEVKPGVWHKLVVEFAGEEMLAVLDGAHIAHGKHEALKKEKTNVGLTVAGEGVIYKEMTVFSGTLSPDWASKKVEFLKKK